MSLSANLYMVPRDFESRAREHVADGDGTPWMHTLENAIPVLDLEDPYALDFDHLKEVAATVSHEDADASGLHAEKASGRDADIRWLNLDHRYRRVATALSREFQQAWETDAGDYSLWKQSFRDPASWAVVGEGLAPFAVSVSPDEVFRYTPPDRVEQASEALMSMDFESCWPEFTRRDPRAERLSSGYEWRRSDFLVPAESLRAFLRIAAASGRPVVHSIDF